VVAFIHRDSYYNRDEELTESDRAKSELIIAKQRNGPTGTVHLNFISKFTCFENPEMTHEA
jgi:replicative DNA helicase